MKELVIVGTGGFAREVFWHAQNSLGFNEEFKFKCFIEGNVPISEERNCVLPGLFKGTVYDYIPEQDDIFVMAITDVNAKELVASIVKSKGGKFTNLIHKTALVSEYAKLGEGVVLCPFTTVSCNAVIGDFVMLNVYSDLGHDAVVGDYSSIMSHVDITGYVKVGTHTFWGSGSRALPHVKIGSNTIIGAGSVVINRVKDNQKVFGVPAKVFKF